MVNGLRPGSEGAPRGRLLAGRQVCC